MILISKIVTGEEIIGEVTHNEDNTVTIKNPCAVAFFNSKETNQQQLGLMPYAAYTKNHTIVIKESNIIWQSELVDEVYNQYNRVFGSGIQIVNGVMASNQGKSVASSVIAS